MRKEFQLTPEQLDKLLDACKPTPATWMRDPEGVVGT